MFDQVVPTTVSRTPVPCRQQYPSQSSTRLQQSYRPMITAPDESDFVAVATTVYTSGHCGATTYLYVINVNIGCNRTCNLSSPSQMLQEQHDTVLEYVV